MKKINLFLVLLICVFQSCTDNECDLLCVIPPQIFQFEIVDITSGEVYLRMELMSLKI